MWRFLSSVWLLVRPMLNRSHSFELCSIIKPPYNDCPLNKISIIPNRHFIASTTNVGIPLSLSLSLCLFSEMSSTAKLRKKNAQKMHIRIDFYMGIGSTRNNYLCISSSLCSLRCSLTSHFLFPVTFHT